MSTEGAAARPPTGHAASMTLDLDLGVMVSGLCVKGDSPAVLMYGRPRGYTIHVVGTPDELIRWRDEVVEAVGRAVAEDTANRETGT